MESKLNPKQQAFADFYIESGNATQAAIRAGYSEKYANTNASKLLQNTTIKSYIDAQMAEIKTERIADQTEILETLTSILRGESRSAILKGIGEGAQVIEEEMPPTTPERVRAAELLGKRYAMWTDKQQVDGVAQVVIKDDLDD